jgi:hypothetical protein
MQFLIPPRFGGAQQAAILHTTSSRKSELTDFALKLDEDSEQAIRDQIGWRQDFLDHFGCHPEGSSENRSRNPCTRRSSE